MASTTARVSRVLELAKTPNLVECGPDLPFDAMIIVNEGFGGFDDSVNHAERRAFLARQSDWKVVNIVVKFYYREIKDGKMVWVYEELTDHEKEHVGVVFGLNRDNENSGQAAVVPVAVWIANTAG